MWKKFFWAFSFFFLSGLYSIQPAWTAEQGQKEKEAPSVDGTLEFGIRPITKSGTPAPETPANEENAPTGGQATDKKDGSGEESSGKTSLETKKEEGRGDGKEKNEALEEYKEEYKEDEEEYAGTSQETPDPLEDFNRAMFQINDFLYENVMEPVATVYTEVTDEDLRGMVKSFFYNVKMPVRLVSSVIQGDGHKAGVVLSSFLINTLMTGGLVDVARTEFGLGSVDEDFDQAMGAHGVKTGPYLVLPLIGPGTFRSTVGGFVDGFLDPTWLISPSFGTSFGMSSGKKINETAINLGVKDEIDDMSVDSYLGMRDLYLQYRKGKLEE